MGRPKIYSEPHFNLYTYTQKGKTYVGAYRNEWDKVKKRSHIVQRKYVGTLDEQTGRVRLGKKYLSENPQYEGKILYYEDKQLVERSEEEVQKEIEERSPSPINDVVSYGASLAAWKTGESCGMLNDLVLTFGPQLGTVLMQLGVYHLLDGGSLDCFENWITQNWLPDVKVWDGRRLSELLAKVDQQHITDYFKLRNARSSAHFSKLKEKAERLKQKDPENAPVLPKYRYLALDSTAISSYSLTIEDAAWGHAKQNPELRQINFTLGVDYLSGDVCYAYESEGSINDKALYPNLLDMKNNGYELDKTVLVTDRGYESIYNVQRLINVELNYVTGVPLSEDSVKALFKKYKSSLDNIAFLNGHLGVTARSVEEDFNRYDDVGGKASVKTHLHLYKYPLLAAEQTLTLQKKIEEALSHKDRKLKVDPAVWSSVKNFVLEKDGTWTKNYPALEEFMNKLGCFAIRSNCLSDPFECMYVYKQRQIVETAFRQMKVENGSNRLRCTSATYLGKFLVFVIAQSLRMKMLFTVRANEEKTKEKLPGDSLDKALYSLKAMMAVRPPSKAIWIGRPVSKKARDVLELLGFSSNFPRNLKL